MTIYMGIEPASGADGQEEKRDARERASTKPRRQGRWPGWPRLRRAIPFSSTTFFLTNPWRIGFRYAIPAAVNRCRIIESQTP